MPRFHHILLAEDDADDRALFKEALLQVAPSIQLAMVETVKNL